MLNNLLEISDNPTITIIWAALSSQIAIIIYLVILLFSILVLFIVVISARSKEELEKDELEIRTTTDRAIPISSEKVEEKEEKAETKKSNKPRDSRFYMLTETDKRSEEIKSERYDRAESLAEICERFRDFCASKLKLYYEISDIRRFIAGMATSHVLIMQGMSGTGKTSLAYAFGEFLSNPSTIVPIQPMWKERTDIIGYYNEFTKKFNETLLLQKMYDAN